MYITIGDGGNKEGIALRYATSAISDHGLMIPDSCTSTYIERFTISSWMSGRAEVVTSPAKEKSVRRNEMAVLSITPSSFLYSIKSPYPFKLSCKISPSLCYNSK